MAKVGRNSPCPCGSGEKYKRCCESKEAKMRESPLPPGRFCYEHGSYGGPGGYMPSILCHRETGPNTWVEHFCLVKPDVIFDEEDSASETAEKHLAEVRALMDTGGNIQDFALSLRHKGYKSVSDFSVIRDDREVLNNGCNGSPINPAPGEPRRSPEKENQWYTLSKKNLH